MQKMNSPVKQPLQYFSVKDDFVLSSILFGSIFMDGESAKIRRSIKDSLMSQIDQSATCGNLKESKKI